MAVIVPFDIHERTSIDELVRLVKPDMERVNATILSRTGSDVTMIPEVANHLISSGGKRMRPMLTVANPYPFDPSAPEQTSFAVFHFFAKQQPNCD